MHSRHGIHIKIWKHDGTILSDKYAPGNEIFWYFNKDMKWPGCIAAQFNMNKLRFGYEIPARLTCQYTEMGDNFMQTFLKSEIERPKKIMESVNVELTYVW